MRTGRGQRPSAGKGWNSGALWFWRAVVCTGLLVLALALHALPSEITGAGWIWMVLLALSLGLGLLAYEIPGIQTYVTPSETIAFLGIILYGPHLAALVGATEGLVTTLRVRPGRLHTALFSATTMATSLYLAGGAYHLAGGTPMIRSGSFVLQDALGPLLLMAMVHHLVNTGLVAGMVHLRRRKATRFLRFWFREYGFTVVTFLSSASLASLVALLALRAGWTAVLAASPLLAGILYINRLHTQGKVDEQRHQLEVNKAYRQTLFTLAQAIDARDALTHGHAHRVHEIADGIAKVLKLSGRRRETVAAAAQLHDIGKLAIPDYILNKPGQLTATERQLMHTHPVVGAQILEEIPFPGPVLPAVRHHHEAWDGSGYPDGLQGTDIPLAARILAVADHFDALSRDQPWQSGLSGRDAFAVIKAGAGRLFDPEVVRAFEQCAFWQETAAGIKGKTVPVEEAAAGAAALQVIAAAQRDSRLLHETLLELGASLDLGETFEVIGRHLGERMPEASGVVYLARPGACKLEATYAWGPGRESLIGRRINSDEGAAGSTMQQGETVINVDPGSDLDGVNAPLRRRLQSAAAVPLVDAAGDVEGVIALYATGTTPFSVAQIQWIDGLASKAAEAVRNARRFSEAQGISLNNGETTPPLGATIREQFEFGLRTCRREGDSLVVLVVRLQGLNEVAARSGPQMRKQVMDEIATHVSRQTGPGMFMGQGGRHSLILVGRNLTQGESANLRQRIEQEITSLRCVIGPSHIAGVVPSVGLARYPQDGRQARTLLGIATRRARVRARDHKSVVREGVVNLRMLRPAGEDRPRS